MSVPKITFLPFNKIVEVQDGTTVFAAARSEGIMVDTACGGKGTCGLCRVRVVSGAEHLPAMEYEEKRFIGTMTSLRLSCRIAPFGDVCVDVPPPRPKKNERDKINTSK